MKWRSGSPTRRTNLGGRRREGPFFTKGALGVFRSILSVGAGPVGAALLAPILARTLGPEGRGQLAAVLSPLVLADVVASVGLPAAVAYYTARGVNRRQLIRIAWPFLFGAASLAYLLLWFIAPVIARHNGLSETVLRVIWIGVYLGAIIACARGVQEGERSWRTLNLESIASPVLRLTFCLLALLFGLSSPTIIAGVYLLSGVLGSAVIFNFKPSGARGPSVWLSRRSFYSFGIRAWSATLGMSVRPRFDQFVLALIVVPSALGLYAVSVTLAELPNIVYLAIARYLFPKIAMGYPLSASFAVFRLTMVCATSFAIAVGLFALPILKLVFGPEFAGATHLLYILLGASVLSAGATILAALCSASGYPGAMSATEAVSIIALLAGLAFVVPWLGVSGAAWVMLIGQALLMISRVLLTSQRFHIPCYEIVRPRVDDFSAILASVSRHKLKAAE